MTTVKITDIPGEVLSHKLLPLLPPNDVVRLRRVCKKLKSAADDHLRLHIRNNRTLHIGTSYNEISDRDDNKRRDKLILMKRLLKLKCHLPVSKFSICFPPFRGSSKENSFEEDKWKIPEFVDKYGKQITHLTITKLSTPLKNQKEIAFYEGLPNLTHLTIMEMRLDAGILENGEQAEYHFPATFKNLKYLAVHLVIICLMDEVAVKKYFWSLVEFCENLETFVYPFGICSSMQMNMDRNRNAISLGYDHLGNLLRNGKFPKLNSYDLNHVYVDQLYAMGGPLAFAEFCQVCNQHNVKLHVKGYFFGELNDTSLLESIGRSIVSLLYPSNAILKTILPNVENLDLDSHSVIYNVNRRFNWDEVRVPVWPNLKRLTYHVDRPTNYNQSVALRLNKIFHIIFEATRRPSVKSLEFVCPLGPRIRPTPKLRKIAWSCFNLTTVKLVNWSGTDKEVSLFWGKLPLLEEVCLKACTKLGDSAFIGENVNEPIFLGLKNLRKLSLIDMHKMPKITDALFKMVIRHLPLREFYITSWKLESSDLNLQFKIHSITKAGIKSLLTSHFARSIERFPFDSWRLSDMEFIEFWRLGNRFRSWHML